MWGRIMKLPNIKILDEKEKILHKKALPVTEFPISKEDQKNIEDMITYLTMSQIEEYSEKYDLRPGMGLAYPQIGIGKIIFVAYFFSKYLVFHFSVSTVICSIILFIY